MPTNDINKFRIKYTGYQKTLYKIYQVTKIPEKSKLISTSLVNIVSSDFFFNQQLFGAVIILSLFCVRVKTQGIRLGSHLRFPMPFQTLLTLFHCLLHAR